ncbi:hypothetical protein [Brucella pseudintermedia]|uniref:hypothetical protein n=1 Tax=Brucella pseudintermedia TaxID=370111 RepID=UPI0030F3EF43
MATFKAAPIWRKEMPQSPYDWTGKRTEKRDRQRRVLIVTAITMGALIIVLGMVDGLLILLG